MITISVTWDTTHAGADHAIKLSRWCAEQGLIQGIDYQWHFVPLEKKSIFTFMGNAESYATFFSLKWTGNEI
jgi:hypothetical protein